jgi:hypothetical protein
VEESLGANRAGLNGKSATNKERGASLREDWEVLGECPMERGIRSPLYDLLSDAPRSGPVDPIQSVAEIGRKRMRRM